MQTVFYISIPFLQSDAFLAIWAVIHLHTYSDVVFASNCFYVWEHLVNIKAFPLQ